MNRWIQQHREQGEERAALVSRVLELETKRPLRGQIWELDLSSRRGESGKASWSPEPSWIQTDQIVTVDTQERVLRHLVTILDPSKLDEVDDSRRSMLDL